MSRIGKKPIAVPEKAEVTLSSNVITVKGPKGTLSWAHPIEVSIQVDGPTITVLRRGTSLRSAALWGTASKLIQNLLEGVTTGFQKQLELNGVGFRMTSSGKKLNLALGFSHPIEVALPDGVEAKIENNILTLTSADKQKLGQFAAEVKRLKPVEPYKGKGFRFVGEAVRRKEGKKAAAA